MVICGIDPSFTRTGIVVMDGSRVVFAEHLPKNTNGDIHNITTTMYFSHQIGLQIKEIIHRYLVDKVIIEYPVLASQTGCYLGLIQQAIYSHLFNLNIEAYLVPATAVESYSKTRKLGKSSLSSWAYAHKAWQGKKPNHDVATAFILCCILMRITQGTYKLTYKHVAYDRESLELRKK